MQTDGKDMAPARDLGPAGGLLHTVANDPLTKVGFNVSGISVTAHAQAEKPDRKTWTVFQLGNVEETVLVAEGDWMTAHLSDGMPSVQSHVRRALKLRWITAPQAISA